MKIVATLLLLSVSVFGAVTNVAVTGVIPTQAIIRYTSPDTTSCVLEVSESAGYSPVVHDVNTSLFSGSNSDGGGSRNRVFVVGKQTAARASDNKIYSRALREGTQHFFRITCGADQATGKFITSPIPFGRSYTESLPHDPDNPGDYLWPSTDWFNRNQTVIDPQTGAFMKRISIARDVQNDYNNRIPTAASGTNCVNPSNVMTDDANVATYNGASCGATCDWLYIQRTDSPSVNVKIDYYRLDVKGSSSEADAENRKLETCITLDGATCASNVKEATLPTTESTVYVPSSSPTPIDTWRQTGYNHEIVTADIKDNADFGFLIRKKTNVGSVSVQFTQYQLKLSNDIIHPSGTSFDVCNSSLTTGSDGRQYYLCAIRVAGGAPAALYSFAPADGTVHYLGIVRAGDASSSPTVSVAACVYDNFPKGYANPLVLYCGRTDTSGNIVAMRGVFQGEISQDVTQNNDANIAWKNVTPGSATSNYPLGRHVEALIQKFTEDNSSHFPVAYDQTKFACNFDSYGSVQQDYVMYQCRRATQDSYGWIAIYDAGNGGTVDVDWVGQNGNTSPIVAAAPTWMRAPTRWCGLH